MNLSLLLRGLAAGIVLALPLPVLAQPDQVVLRIVVMRHGVRSPTKAPETLGVYANEPWAKWPVGPGLLTPHGVEAMRQLGVRWRQDLRAEGLLAPGCEGADTLRIIADSTPRNHDSAAALMDGLLPGCARAQYLALPAGEHDPLFQGPSGADEELMSPQSPSDALPREALSELERVLLGGVDEARLAAARARGKRILLDMADPFKLMGTLSENLMLEHVQGMPAPAWGRADEAGIGRLIQLHNASFARAWVKNPSASQRRSSELLLRVAQTLAGQSPGLGGKDVRVIVLVAHDSNLAALAGLLQLDWHLARQPDDYPPGGALVFDLVRTEAGPMVRVRSSMPTLAALRAADFSGDAALVRQDLLLPGCQSRSCPLERFRGLVGQVIDRSAVRSGEPQRTLYPRMREAPTLAP